MKKQLVNGIVLAMGATLVGCDNVAVLDQQEEQNVENKGFNVEDIDVTMLIEPGTTINNDIQDKINFIEEENNDIVNNEELVENESESESDNEIENEAESESDNEIENEAESEAVIDVLDFEIETTITENSNFRVENMNYNEPIYDDEEEEEIVIEEINDAVPVISPDYSDETLESETVDSDVQVEDNYKLIMGIDECRVKIGSQLGIDECDLYYTGAISDPQTGALVETFANVGCPLGVGDAVYGITADLTVQENVNFKMVFSDGSVVNFYTDGTDAQEKGFISDEELGMIRNNINSLK